MQDAGCAMAHCACACSSVERQWIRPPKKDVGKAGWFRIAMTHVATLVCDPAFPVLTGELVARACKNLTNPARPQWLEADIAVDIPFDPIAPDSSRTVADRLRGALESTAVDVFVQALKGRRKKLLLADLDSTMIGQECIDELAGEIGKRAEIAAITVCAMRGEIAFEPALRKRVALLKGLDRATIFRAIASRITLTKGGLPLVQTMRRNGAYTALISGGFSVFTSAIAGKLGFDEHQANELLFDEDGRASGLVAEPVLSRQAKLSALTRLRERLRLCADETLAVGDGANDLAMLEAAGFGVAFRAKPTVAFSAHARVDHGDLTALLYAQGYRRDEFVTSINQASRPTQFL
jgi:phosphoserine phosphatase